MDFKHNFKKYEILLVRPPPSMKNFILFFNEGFPNSKLHLNSSSIIFLSNMKYVQNYCEFYIVLLNILYKQLEFLDLDQFMEETYVCISVVCGVSIIMPYKCIAVAATPATF